MAEDEKMSLPLKILFCLVLALGGVVYGFFATTNHWWIADRINDVRAAFILVGEDLKRPWYLSMPRSEHAVKTHRADELQPGLLLVTGIDINHNNFIKVIDRDGTVLHSWQPDWFEIWPEMPEVIPASRAPQKLPGAVLHGIEMLETGDIVFNYELLSTIRMGACGDVQWKLDNLGHHSVHLAEDGTIYVGSEKVYFGDDQPPYLNHTTPLNSFAIQQLDRDGNELMFKEILEILVENDLQGLMHLGTLENVWTNVAADTMHLNDIEVFPSNLESEIFEPGDLMLSLRNINTIIVVDPETWKIKFQSTGAVLRHHDPDFAPDDKILVLDNRNLNPFTPQDQLHSRIVEIDARTGAHRTYFRGEGAAHFYTPAMGKFQKLENGNLLINSTQEGRIFEVNPAGDLVWEYNNIVDETNNGVLMEGHVLPSAMNREFFENIRANCENV